LDCQNKGKNASPVCTPITMPLVDLAIWPSMGMMRSLHRCRLAQRDHGYKRHCHNTCMYVCDVCNLLVYAAVDHPNGSI
jgi:hypothetical protein